MALSQALSTGITGLMSHQKAMDNIGNNLANVNTVGFKKGVYQFTTILEQTLRGGMMADAGTGRGSVNPISLGLGTQTGSINKVFTQGPIENTGNPNDMAIDGNGFFVLRQGNGHVYTRAGSFYRGEDGTLMAGNGLYVQGTMAVKNSDGSMSIPQDAKLQNIVIPIGVTGGHSQTTEVAFTGNLDSRQEISTGSRLFGTSNFPTVSNLQQWMWTKDWNGGDPDVKKNADPSWNSLETKTYSVSQQTIRNYLGANAQIKLPGNVNLYSDEKVVSFEKATAPGTPTGACVTCAYDINTGKVVELGGYMEVGGTAWDTLEATLATTLIPMVEEVKVINGGNVQTSAAYGVEVPEFLSQGVHPFNGKNYTVSNDYTYPPWFYESTGGDFATAAALTNTDFTTNLAQCINDIWPNGYNPQPHEPASWPATLPVKGEIYPASVNTPLENIRYYKGNVWVQPFKNLKNGDEIDLTFKKGDSQINATFVYNRPVGPDPFNGQQAIDRERSWTLGHFLAFMAGDVDEPSIACQNITPAMFGAPITVDYPDGDYDDPTWRASAGRMQYEEALRNVSLAIDEGNWDTTGGVMGVLSIPPKISDANFGPDSYDAPVESGGAYTRTGVQEVQYLRVDPVTGNMVRTKAPSFNVSIVSNLGQQNAISDIKITYNNVPHESMFNAEKEYNVPQGGSSMVTVDFYDSLGNPRTATVRMAMVEQSDDFTTWRWYADCVDDTDFPWQADPETGELISNLNVGTGLIRFDKNGNFIRGAEYSESNGITINQSNKGVNEPIVIALLNGLSSSSTQDLDFSGLTCTADASGMKLKSQNGRPPGTLDDFVVSADGVIQGVYSNGNVVDIARIGLAIIPNENGLIAAGNNLFYTGPASGDAQYGHANTGGNGSIRHMQLESSNVDLSEEFTKLISTERGFQANSRTITTADEMITELLNLKR